MNANARSKKPLCNTNPCDSENLNLLLRRDLLRDLDDDAMMQLVEVAASNVRRKKRNTFRIIRMQSRSTQMGVTLFFLWVQTATEIFHTEFIFSIHV